MNSVLQNWVMRLPRRHQGVLLSICRGFDGWKKHADEKRLIREMRGLVLVPFDERELEIPGGYMTKFYTEWSDIGFKAFCDNIDELSLHYVMHVVHAAEIIGYHHPAPGPRRVYLYRYGILVHKFHLNIETREEMDERLTSDRIKEGTVDK